MFRRRLRRRFRRRIKRRGSTRTYRKTFGRKVKSVLYQTAELKQQSNNIGQTLPANILRINMAPTIVQGSGDNQRIGNTIMARNWQIKLWYELFGNSSVLTRFRVFIVWPRKLSRSEAISQITTTNFPLYGMIDQDNWIVWHDRSYQITATPVNNPTINQLIRWEFNKRFPAKLEYKNAGEDTPTKEPWFIIVHDNNILLNNFNITGYIKLSYKDI
jgi:hypothetical protein